MYEHDFFIATHNIIIEPVNSITYATISQGLQ